MKLSKKLPSSNVVKNIKIEVNISGKTEMVLSTEFSIEDTIKVLKEGQEKLEREASPLPIKKG